MTNFHQTTEMSVRTRRPVLWSNCAALAHARADDLVGHHSPAIEDARARLDRFAPLLVRLFPELAASSGRIDSRLRDIRTMDRALGFRTGEGRFLAKCDHDLPIGGSIKARGGIYAVLEIAERVARREGLLETKDHVALAEKRARSVFARHSISVGSTGNLGLSVGLMAVSLGFAAIVHMSSDAKDWKKRRLRGAGVEVVEHAGDYEAALAAGRTAARDDDHAHFIDDEDSLPLLYGYATAADDVRRQLAEARVAVDSAHPLLVYLPCGVGGAPSGIALGLKGAFRNDVHCFFAEPVDAPCFLIEMLTEDGSHPSIYDYGLTGSTEADGLAVPRASRVAAEIARAMVAGVYTVEDRTLFRHLELAAKNGGMRLEPSAAAGFDGPAMVLGSPAGRAYLARSGLERVIDRATHLVWTTGGRLVPDAEYSRFLDRGRRADETDRSNFLKEGQNP